MQSNQVSEERSNAQAPRSALTQLLEPNGSNLGKREAESPVESLEGQSEGKRRQTDDTLTSHPPNQLLGLLTGANPEASKPVSNGPSKASVDEAPAKPKKRKTVRWQEHSLEEIKFFKMNDEPNAPGLSFAEVNEIQKHLADVPSHMIPSELQKIENNLDRKLLQERKGCELLLKTKLAEMKPLIRFTRQGVFRKYLSD